MKAANILLSLLFLTGTQALAEIIDKKNARRFVRNPLADAFEPIKYDGWTIQGDRIFQAMMIKHLKFIEKNCPEIYAKGKKYVKHIEYRGGGAGSAAAPWKKIIGIGERDINFRQYGDDWVIYIIAHEIQHCVPNNGSEPAAKFVAVVYGKQLQIHPALVRWLGGTARGMGYTQQKWNKLEK